MESIEDLVDPFGSEGGDLEYLKSYEEIQVANTKIKLKDEAKKYILSMVELYFDVVTPNNEKMKESIARIESMTLANLLTQVSYSQHILDTLMRQLDNGGYMDDNLYTKILAHQEKCLKITLTVSKYFRELPQYFKSVEEDMKDHDPTGVICDVTDLNENQPTKEIGENKPFRGTKDITKRLLDIQKEKIKRNKE